MNVSMPIRLSRVMAMFPLAIAIGVLSIGGIVGCGGGVSENVVRTTQVSFDDAVDKEATGDVAGALASIEVALAGGGLNPDQLAEAYLLRARCYAATGDLEKAEADIEWAEQGAPNPAKVHLTRGILYEKQGRAAESKAELNAAKRADPSITLP